MSKKYFKKNIRLIPGVKEARRIQFKIEIKIAKLKKKEVIHFIHIGKTAGTSIKFALNYKKLTFTKNAVLVLENHDFKLNQLNSNEKVFFIVRDPLSRFVSGFYSRFREGKPRIYNPWKPKEKAAFELFETPVQLGEALTSSNENLRCKAEEAMCNIGHVQSSYWDWFISEECLKKNLNNIAWVGRQENLSSDFQILKNKYCLNSNHNLPNNNIKKHSTPDSFNKKLSQIAKRNLKNWYKNDYYFLKILYDNGKLESSY